MVTSCLSEVNFVFSYNVVGGSKLFLKMFTLAWGRGVARRERHFFSQNVVGSSKYQQKKSENVYLGWYWEEGERLVSQDALQQHLYKQVQPFSSSFWPQLSRLITSSYNAD